MSAASKCDVELYFDKITLLEGTQELAASGVIPGGSRMNLRHLKEKVDFGTLNEMQQLLLADAQTSGGLLLVVDKNSCDSMLLELKEKGVKAASIIGHFREGRDGRISIN